MMFIHNVELISYVESAANTLAATANRRRQSLTHDIRKFQANLYCANTDISPGKLGI